MILCCRGLSSGYEIEMLARMFFPGLSLQAGVPDEGDFLLVEKGDRQLLVKLRRDGRFFSETAKCREDPSENELALARMLYRCALQSGADPLRWGILTGVRPIKLFHRMAAEGLTPGEQAARMQERFLLDPAMISLAQEIQRTEQRMNEKSARNGFSLYVSIPFCPQRCSYCSFVSQDISRFGSLIPQYVEALACEIQEIAQVAKNLGLLLQTVYFGGGTPTTLDAEQLAFLFQTIEKNFDTCHLLEYTVEAGRPDTIDAARLAACKAAGVTRISVNPQTMNTQILSAVGRCHSAEDVIRAFSLARDAGFGCINMDLIAGLPGEEPAQFLESLDKVLALSPDNVTVHALTLKRASRIAAQRSLYDRSRQVAEMIDRGRARIRRAGLSPYYLYRQKNTIGSLDNTGYSRPGREGFYNVFIMDETQTILAAGAGAVTKLRAPGSGTIRRIYNYKYPAEYLSGFDLLKKRKETVREFYEANQ